MLEFGLGHVTTQSCDPFSIRADFLQQLANFFRRFLRYGAEQPRGFFQSMEPALDELVGFATGNCFNAANAGRNAALFCNNEDADVSGFLDVRTTTKLVGERLGSSNCNGPDGLGIFFAK
jgi:hypothetical protein